MSTAVKLHFVVVGCGPAGLCATLSLAKSGHSVTALEANDQLVMLGAGVTTLPSGSKALRRLGLGSWLEEKGVKKEKIVYIRYANGEVLGTDTVEQTFGAACYSVHRGHFVKKLYDVAVKNENIKIRFNARAETVDPGSETSQPFVTLFGGEKIVGDVVIGADVVKSVIRPVVTGQNDRPTDTGDAAYRALVPSSLILKDPEIAQFIDEPSVNIWFGPARHIVAYSINAKEDFNLVMFHKRTDNTEESWTQKGDPDKMRALYENFEPRYVEHVSDLGFWIAKKCLLGVQKLLALVDSAYLWKLVDRPHITNWVHESGKVLVIGDACHPVLPYRAQGANMAIEDAEAIGSLFSHISCKDEIKDFTTALHTLRAARCRDAVEGARKRQHMWALADGPEQEARDEALKQTSNGPSRLSSYYAYDALAEVNAWWDARSAASRKST